MALLSKLKKKKTSDSKESRKKAKPASAAAEKKPKTRQKKITEKKDSKVSSKRVSKKHQKLMEEHEKRWQSLKLKNTEKPKLYKISGVYQEKTPIEHKKFGLGFILSIKNRRLEVIFKDSVKHLVSDNLGVVKTNVKK